jgi:hypothetical protein
MGRRCTCNTGSDNDETTNATRRRIWRVPDSELIQISTAYTICVEASVLIIPPHAWRRLEASPYRFNTPSDGRMVIFPKTDRDSDPNIFIIPERLGRDYAWRRYAGSSWEGLTEILQQTPQRDYTHDCPWNIASVCNALLSPNSRYIPDFYCFLHSDTGPIYISLLSFCI